MHWKQPLTIKGQYFVISSIICECDVKLWNLTRKTTDWNRLVNPNTSKHAGWWARVQIWPPKPLWVGYLDRSGTELIHFCSLNLQPSQVTRTHWKHYICWRYDIQSPAEKIDLTSWIHSLTVLHPATSNWMIWILQEINSISTWGSLKKQHSET